MIIETKITPIDVFIMNWELHNRDRFFDLKLAAFSLLLSSLGHLFYRHESLNPLHSTFLFAGVIYLICSFFAIIVVFFLSFGNCIIGIFRNSYKTILISIDNDKIVETYPNGNIMVVHLANVKYLSIKPDRIYLGSSKGQGVLIKPNKSLDFFEITGRIESVYKNSQIRIF